MFVHVCELCSRVVSRLFEISERKIDKLIEYFCEFQIRIFFGLNVYGKFYLLYEIDFRIDLEFRNKFSVSISNLIFNFEQG